MPYRIGDRIEVFGFKDEDAHSFFQATITEMAPKFLTIQHEHLRDLEGQPWINFVPYMEVRPYPPLIKETLNHGDDVDAWLDSAWVKGTYRRCEPKHPEGLVHRIHFPHLPKSKRFHSFKTDHVRLHQQFQFVDDLQNFGAWTYKRRVRMGYQLGDKVEVLANEPAIENYLYKAKVDHVFRHQVLATLADLKDDDNEPLQALATMDNVRPYPSKIAMNFLPGDHVEVLYNNGWRSATYRDYLPNHPNGLRHQVRFDHIIGRQRISSFARSAIRLRQQFRFENKDCLVAVWTYKKRI